MTRYNKITEHDEQATLIEWADRMAQTRYPELKLIFAIPNGGLRNKVVAARLKAEGVKSGVPDLFLPVAIEGYHGLFLEMKTKKGKPSDNQRAWCSELIRQNYYVSIAHGFDEAVEIILAYVKGNPIKLGNAESEASESD